jgi:uncharacterized protein YkwD
MKFRSARCSIAIAAVSVSAGLASCAAGGSAQRSEGAKVQPTSAARSFCPVGDVQAALVARINSWRAQGADCGSAGRFKPAAPLAWNRALALAARRHSEDMAARNFFAHASLSGSQPAQRVSAAGYEWRAVAENIAAGRYTPAEVIDQWIASPGHCANLMSPEFVHVGAACVVGGRANEYDSYWTLNLAAPRR